MNKYLGLLIVVFLSFWAVQPFFHDGFFSMHDDTQVARVFEMAQALVNGQFPVRWVADLGYGYGYPLFNFYSPLPYYFGGLLVVFGLDALIATKMMFIIGILMAGIFMYFLTREIWGELGAIISAIFYTYVPYHAVQIYVRGSVGEFWALIFIPLMVLGFYKIITELKLKWIIIAGFGYAGIILSHNLTAMMITLFLMPFYGIVLIMDFKKRNLLAIKYLILSTFLGIALSAFYWLPAIAEMSYTNVAAQVGGSADFRGHFVCFWQLWISNWGFAGSASGCVNDGMSFMAGKFHLLMSFVALIVGLYLWHTDKIRSKIIFLSFIFYLLSVFMLLQISLPVWQILPFLAFIQYPWRFLTLVIFFTSFLSGAIFFMIKNKILKFCVMCFVLCVLLFYNLKYFQPQKYLEVTASDYTNYETLIWKTSKISDEYLAKGFPVPKTENEIASIAGLLKSKPLEYNFKQNTITRTFANLISLASLLIIIGSTVYVKKTN